MIEPPLNSDLEIVHSKVELTPQLQTPQSKERTNQNSLSKLDLTGVEPQMPKKLTPQLHQAQKAVAITSGSHRLEKNSNLVIEDEMTMSKASQLKATISSGTRKDHRSTNRVVQMTGTLASEATPTGS